MKRIRGRDDVRLKTMLLCCALFAAPAAAADYRDAVKADYDKHLEALFLDFHKNPELSYVETRTARIIAKELRAAGGGRRPCQPARPADADYAPSLQ